LGLSTEIQNLFRLFSHGREENMDIYGQVGILLATFLLLAAISIIKGKLTN
jgi:hypothetical protein